MVNTEETHITERQFEVLRKKREGKSLREIADELGTSRSNVSSIAKTAEQNLEKSKNTIKLFKTIEWPIKVDVESGTNIYDVSEVIFEKADKKEIDLSLNYSKLVRIITENLGKENLERRKTLKDFSIMVNEEGKIEVI
ncbi:MAG: Tfx family DNA-binding protein [Hadesarchaea archaeon]|nr:Tfx family DNA-binding protein [Hadesarchaea archaeon]